MRHLVTQAVELEAALPLIMKAQDLRENSPPTVGQVGPKPVVLGLCFSRGMPRTRR